MDILSIISGLFNNSSLQEKLFDAFKGQPQKKRDFEIKLQEILKEDLEIHLKDLQSARSLQQTALRQDDKFSKRFLYYLTAFLMAVTSLVSILPMVLTELPAENMTLINRATDFYYTISGGAILAFFFGKQQKS